MKFQQYKDENGLNGLPDGEVVFVALSSELFGLGENAVEDNRNRLSLILKRFGVKKEDKLEDIATKIRFSLNASDDSFREKFKDLFGPAQKMNAISRRLDKEEETYRVKGDPIDLKQVTDYRDIFSSLGHDTRGVNWDKVTAFPEENTPQDIENLEIESIRAGLRFVLNWTEESR